MPTTAHPSSVPTTGAPSPLPSPNPTASPTSQPSPLPSIAPSESPTANPTSDPSPYPTISPVPTIAPTLLEPPDPPVNVTLDPDTSGATWTDEGYGGEASTYLLYDGGILAVAVDSIDPLLRRRLLFTDDYDRRELKGGKDKNRTRGGGGGSKNRDGSERTWNSKRGWRRRNAKTLSYALEENVACYSTVVLTVVAENAAGASEPSEPFERTLNGCWRDPTHVPTTAQPSSNPTPVP